MKRSVFLAVAATATIIASAVSAAPVYLNQDNISVSVGPNTSPGTFNNTFANGQTINKVIDAPSADAEEFHNQTTHIWFTADEVGGGLELLFDFGVSFDITTLHFWNFTGEDFDVDEVEFSFFDAVGSLIGTETLFPDLGSSPGIKAQDIPLVSPLNTRSVTAFLTGTNRQVDFQNIGFTAELSDPANDPVAPSVVPLPAGGLLLLGSLGALGLLRRRLA